MKTTLALIVAMALWLGSDVEAEAHHPYVTYYAPVPHAVYYAPAPVVYQPVARVRTRYRPFLGGSVTRVRYGYAPTYYVPPVVYAY